MFHAAIIIIIIIIIITARVRLHVTAGGCATAGGLW